jgi:hypothetical protein
MTYQTIESEYFDANDKYSQATKLISRDRSQAINLLREANNLLSNCNSPQAKQLAKKVQKLLNQYGG